MCALPAISANGCEFADGGRWHFLLRRKLDMWWPCFDVHGWMWTAVGKAEHMRRTLCSVRLCSVHSANEQHAWRGLMPSGRDRGCE